LLRADSAFYNASVVKAALTGGADVSVTVRQDKRIKAAISGIAEDAWSTIEYTDAIFDEDSHQWISRAEVAEIPFTAFTSKPKSEQVTARLVVRRIPDLNPQAATGQASLFDTWRFHAFVTTTPVEFADTMAPDKTTADTRSLKNVSADLKNRGLAHLPASSPPTPPGWCRPASRSTSPAPPPERTAIA
jgi:hypothetical protein